MTDDRPIVMVGEGITFFRLRALWGAAKLEGEGFKRSGARPSALSILRKEFKFTGNRQQVLDQARAQLDEMVERSRRRHGA